MMDEKKIAILEKLVSKNPSKVFEESKARLKNKTMQRKNIITLIKPLAEPITRGNFKSLCEEFNLPYHSLKMLKFPITYKDMVIYKTPFNPTTNLRHEK